jgi:hypothetical protein
LQAKLQQWLAPAVVLLVGVRAVPRLQPLEQQQQQQQQQHVLLACLWAHQQQH